VKNNEDYMKTTTVSALRLPTLFSVSFPRKQDFWDAGVKRGVHRKGETRGLVMCEGVGVVEDREGMDLDSSLGAISLIFGCWV
jgi:hypothetical protein